jgi:hypothetical protein
MRKLLIVCLIAVFAFAGTAIADPGNGNHYGTNDNNGNHYGWGNNDGPGDGPGGCNGSPECSAEGNFAINTFAAGGGLDLHGALITKGYPVSGAAGGISAAGGVGFGEAEGEFTSFKFFRKTITLGSAGAELYSRGGGQVLVDDAGTFNPGFGDKSIGVYSHSNTVATTAGNLKVNATGLAYSAGIIGGATGQFSADGSIIGPSPLPQWKSVGVSGGVAAQGSAGAFLGYAATGLYGSADVGAFINMGGDTYSQSWRAIDGNTEIMHTDVGASTWVDSDSHVDTHAFAIGGVEGGWIAGGIAASKTIQATPYGVAKAGAVGTYSGAGELGCTFNGSAVGYTQTTATQTPGYRGSIMSSSAGMQVSNNPLPAD